MNSSSFTKIRRLLVDDGFAAVDFVQFAYIVIAETSAFQDLQHLIVEGMLPSTLFSKLAVTLEKVLTDMEAVASFCELADTMLTIAPVII